MTDVIAARHIRRPGAADLAVQWTAFARTPQGVRGVRVGVAVFASAIAAAAICASLPDRTVAPAPDLRTTFEPRVQTADSEFDVTQAWKEEHARLSRESEVPLHAAQTKPWVPLGGMSTLLATRFPSVSNMRLGAPEEKLEASVPLPPPAPGIGVVARQTLAPGRPVEIEPRVASLPPQQSGTGTFNFFRRLFGDPDKPAKTLLAANPKTALYDITKRVVYLPDGEKLEAHSGYGKFMDDPASVAHKNYGVTPPNVYALSFREKPFHGVRALRLTPVGGGDMHGRDGILAHSYLLGEEGASNGCVSLRDYDKFLEAYEDGKFDRIIVVRSADEPAPAVVASAQPGNT